MRVCIFGSEIGPVKKGIFVGGAAVSAIRLSQALHSLGNQVFVFSSAPRGRPSSVHAFDWGIVVNRWIPGRYMSLPYLVAYGFASFFGLLRFCRRKKIEMISNHSGSVILCAVPSVIGKILKVPVVHTQYCEFFINRAGWRRFLDRIVARLCLNLPTRFCAISENVAISLTQAGLPQHKVDVIPPVIPSFERTADSKTDFRNSLRFDDKDLIALFIGNLKRNKGIDVLLEAFIGLAYEIQTLKLIITTELVHRGFWERRRLLEDKLLQHGLTNRVVWLGFVDDMPGLMKEVDVVVVPFLDLEGISNYPLVVLEAINVGTPVVATRVGGTPEVFKEEVAGVLVPPGDADALSNGLKSILTERGKKYRFRRHFRELLPECFDASAVGQRYHDLFLQEMNKIG